MIIVVLFNPGHSMVEFLFALSCPKYKIKLLSVYIKYSIFTGKRELFGPPSSKTLHVLFAISSLSVFNMLHYIICCTHCSCVADKKTTTQPSIQKQARTLQRYRTEMIIRVDKAVNSSYGGAVPFFVQQMNQRQRNLSSAQLSVPCWLVLNNIYLLQSFFFSLAGISCRLVWGCPQRFSLPLRSKLETTYETLCLFLFLLVPLIVACISLKCNICKLFLH